MMTLLNSGHRSKSFHLMTNAFDRYCTLSEGLAAGVDLSRSANVLDHVRKQEQTVASATAECDAWAASERKGLCDHTDIGSWSTLFELQAFHVLTSRYRSVRSSISHMRIPAIQGFTE